MKKNNLLLKKCFLALILVFSCLPGWGFGWKINEKECNCKVVPATTFQKNIRSLFIGGFVNNAENLNFNVVDLKTSKCLNRLKMKKDGRYKVGEKWYQAKWISPTKEELELLRLGLQIQATNAQIFNTIQDSGRNSLLIQQNNELREINNNLRQLNYK